MSKKTVWFEVGENETLDACLERMKSQGYMAMGRKEEPVFEEVNGEPVPVKQIVKFKGIKMEN
ncbi:NETI motif-containing protein [Planomicrobium sp. CPCC 101110]|uniref:NETI motif-containing protein n=1 Tax=Planomicrobium sp. CPCC 101110 TaxID=2599619 RepID=UPI0011B7743D|nr:NETI motif-containing protein [Planomicrobium sp. CPCC 101110]TWT24055.1 NETI motif-containing protein [Planomicrobium sp. CPCC 101110]